MAKVYGPFSTGAGATFTEAQWQTLFGVQPSGVVSGMGLFADSTGMQVKVPVGVAVIQGFVFSDDAQETLSIGAANATNPRIDRLVVRRDFGAKTIDYFVRAGTPLASPVAPTLQRDSAVWELSIGQVTVPANASTIAPGNILDERLNPDVCGLVSALTSEIIQCNSSTRPTVGLVNGTTILEVDTGNMRFWWNGAWSQPIVTGSGALVSPSITGTVSGSATYNSITLTGVKLITPTYLRVSSNQDIGQASTQPGTIRWLKAWGADIVVTCIGALGFNGPGTTSTTWPIKNGDAQTFIAQSDNWWDAV